MQGDRLFIGPLRRKGAVRLSDIEVVPVTPLWRERMDAVVQWSV